MAAMTKAEAEEFIRLHGIYTNTRHSALIRLFEALPLVTRRRFTLVETILKNRSHYGRIPDQQIIQRLTGATRNMAGIDAHELGVELSKYQYGLDWDTIRADPPKDKFQQARAHQSISRLERAFQMLLAGEVPKVAMGRCGLYYRGQSPTTEQMNALYDYERGRDFTNPVEWMAHRQRPTEAVAAAS